jgi:hypothetical protein
MEGFQKPNNKEITIKNEETKKEDSIFNIFSGTDNNEAKEDSKSDSESDGETEKSKVKNEEETEKDDDDDEHQEQEQNANDDDTDEDQEQEAAQGKPEQNINISIEPEPLMLAAMAENSKIYDKTVYNFNNETYYYLDSDDASNTLQKNFRNLIKKEAVDFRVKLCLYKIIDECKEPFLQFLLEKKDDTMTLPSFETSSSGFINKSEADELFLDKCSQYLLDIVNNQQISKEIAARCYRGFLEEADNTIYVMFDCTYLHVEINSQRFWGILDEIVNEKYIYKVPIDKEVYTMIQNNEFLAYIKDKNGERINMPCCLYLCKINDSGEYDNLYYNTDEHDMKHKSPTDGKMNHETFGHFYYFTTDPIHKDANISRLKRFSVFIDNALYVLNINKPIDEIDFIADDEDDFDETHKSYRDYTCIYFFEDGLQLWCVKSLSRFIEL